MARIDEIVSRINSSIETNQFYDRRFQKGSFYGIADVIEKTTSQDSTEIYPGVTDNNGNTTRISIDDRKHWFLYHRIEDIDTDNFPDDDFGDAKTIETTYNMQLVLWADRKKLKLNNDKLITGLLGGIPSHLVRSDLTSWNLWSVEINTGAINTNSQAVYRQEYTTSKMPIRSNHVMISISYQVVTTHRQGCIYVCTL